MSRKTVLLPYAATAICLSAFAFVTLPGEPVRADAAPKKEVVSPKERANADPAKRDAGKAMRKVEEKAVPIKGGGVRRIVGAAPGPPPAPMNAGGVRRIVGGNAGAPAIAGEDPMVQQFEQQFGVQFRQLYRSELHFMRLVCQPTKQQYEKISADGAPVLKATTRKFAVMMGELQHGRAMAGGQQSDPRKLIVDGLAKSVRATLSPEQAARYQKELDQRAAARKRVVVLNLLVKLDKALLLTPEQRAKLSEVLEKGWQESWNQTQMLMYGDHYPFPQLPIHKVLPILNETQKNVWRGIPKGSVGFGFDLGIMQGLDIDDEVWDDERPVEKPKRADGKAPVEGKGSTKTEEKK